MEAPQVLFEDMVQRLRIDRIEDTTGSSFTTIFRIPDNLKDQLFTGDDKAYIIPEIVSLGPYHSGHRHLRFMDNHKARALKNVVNDSPETLKIYLDSIYELEPRARACYEDRFDNLSREHFAQMLLLDGCFMFEIIGGHHRGFQYQGYFPNDPVFTERGYGNMASSIIKDMIKLENQVPFFVIEKLSELRYGDARQVAKSVAFMFIKWLTRQKLTDRQLDALTYGDEPVDCFLHCLHIFQRSLLIKELQGVDHRLNTVGGQIERFLSNASNLFEYGIKFKLPMNKSHRPFWDVRFRNGTLEMPRLLINRRLKVALQNLVMLEQKSSDRSRSRVGSIILESLGSSITEYIMFMGKLLISTADVGHLHQAGIIVHQLRSDAEVIKLFTDLGKAAFMKTNVQYQYSDLYMKINRHCNRRNRWKSELKRKYFSNPWTLASLIAAIVLLVLTFLQTYYTLYAYYRPRS